MRTKEEPKKKGIGYKVFFRKDGKLYPPMVANPGGEDTPVGVWLDADEGVRAGESKTGQPQVKAGGLISRSICCRRWISAVWPVWSVGLLCWRG